MDNLAPMQEGGTLEQKKPKSVQALQSVRLPKSLGQAGDQRGQ